MKKKNVFNHSILKGLSDKGFLRKISLMVIPIFVIIILVISTYMIVAKRMPANMVETAVIQEADFLVVNPEARYAGYISVDSTQKGAINFLAANPEAQSAHLDAASLANYLERAFRAVNPEVRFASQVGATASQMTTISFFVENPEARSTHLDTDSLTKTLERDFLAVNPEARYAIVKNNQQGRGDFFEANPEVLQLLRYQDANSEN